MASSDAQQAIFDEIVEVISLAKDQNVATRAEILRHAAIAYRLAYGGQQPGSSVVTS